MKFYTLKIRRSVLRSGEPVMGMTAKDITRYALANCYKKEEMYRERAFLVFIDDKGRITGHFHLSTGGFNQTTLDTRLACVAQLNSMTNRGVLVHNHPTGVPKPSASDMKETDKLHKAYSAIDCKLLDHVIIGEDAYYSFADEKENKIR